MSESIAMLPQILKNSILVSDFATNVLQWVAWSIYGYAGFFLRELLENIYAGLWEYVVNVKV